MSGRIDLTELIRLAGILNLARWRNGALVDPVTDADIQVANYANAYTFATLPAANAVQVSEPYYVTDIGVGGSYWYSDGSKWRPTTDGIVIAQANGSLAAPLDSFTGLTTKVFTPLAVPTIKAGVLTPGQSKVRVEVVVVKSGTGGTANVRAMFGKTAADWVVAMGMANTDNLAYRAFVDFWPGNGQVTSVNWTSANQTAAGAVLDRANADFDTAADQIIAFKVDGANAADTFKMVAYQVTIWP